MRWAKYSNKILHSHNLISNETNAKHTSSQTLNKLHTCTRVYVVHNHDAADDRACPASTTNLKALLNSGLEILLLFFRHAGVFEQTLEVVDLLVSLRHCALVLRRQAARNRLKNAPGPSAHVGIDRVCMRARASAQSLKMTYATPFTKHLHVQCMCMYTVR